MKKLIGIGLIGVLLLGFTAAALAENISLVKFGGGVQVNKDQVVKDAVAIGGSVRVLGEVQESAVAVGGSVYVGPGASVGKDAVSIGGKVTKGSGAVIKGKVAELSSITLPIPGKNTMIFLPAILMTSVILIFIGFLALALVTIALFTPQIGTISYKTEKSFWRALLAGIIGAILIVPIVVLLALSVIGIILIPVFILLLALAVIAGFVSVAQLIGKKVFELIRLGGKHIMAEETVGLILLFLICLIPVLGWIIKMLVIWVGLGAVILTRFGTRDVKAT